MQNIIEHGRSSLVITTKLLHTIQEYASHLIDAINMFRLIGHDKTLQRLPRLPVSTQEVKFSVIIGLVKEFQVVQHIEIPVSHIFHLFHFTSFLPKFLILNIAGIITILT